jgi:L,D-transpeptidase catalytic domain
MFESGPARTPRAEPFCAHIRHDGSVTRRLPLLAIVLLCLVAGACTGSPVGDHATPPPTSSFNPSEAASPAPTAVPANRSHPAGVDAVSRTRYLRMWKRVGDGDPSFVFDTRSPTGHGIAPMLIESRTTRHGQRWLRILLPIRPNGSSAWAHVEDVRLLPRNEKIVVDLSQRTLRDYVRGELVNRFRVAVGSPRTPTGVGTFYVWQRVPFANPYQPYGIFALGLSGFSPVLSDWPGGGRMAIHGTPYASDRGQPVSHGCVRVYNTDMKHLLGVRLGTPVIIRP